jgi:hypothetical protein
MWIGERQGGTCTSTNSGGESVLQGVRTKREGPTETTDTTLGEGTTSEREGANNREDTSATQDGLIVKVNYRCKGKGTLETKDTQTAKSIWGRWRRGFCKGHYQL